MGLLGDTVSFDTNGDMESGAFDFFMVTKNKREKFTKIAQWTSSTNNFTFTESFGTLNLTGKTSKCTEECEPGYHRRYIFT